MSGPQSAPGADPDGDGLTNLLEYALNQDPTRYGQGSNPVQTVIRGYADGNYLSIRFTRAPLATDITYIVEVSSDLATWTAVASAANGAALSGPGVVSDDGANSSAHTVEVRDTVEQSASPGQRRFLRLRVTQP